MRLLVFSPFYPPHIGGLETHSAEFNVHISQLGIDIVCFTPQIPISSQEKELVSPHLLIIRYPAWEPIHNFPIPCWWTRRYWRLWHEATEIRPDIIISRTRFFLSSLQAAFYARFKSIPHVHIEHGSDFVRFHNRGKTLLGKVYDWTCGRLVLTLATTLVANSHASEDFVRRLSGRAATIIYRGYETKHLLHAQTPDDLDSQFQGQIVVGYLGRLIDGKGVHILLEAIANLNRSDLVCWIIGDGPDRSRLESYTQAQGLTSRVIFFGHRPLEEAHALLQRVDIFINPSYGEGLPSSVTEAALSRKAIIATAVGGTSEIISGKNDGILIPPGESYVITEKLKLLLDDSRLRQSLGEQAYVTVKDKFSWDKAINQYRQLFDSLLS